MKRSITLFTLAAFAAVLLTGSCQNKRLDKVAEPTWTDYKDYYIEKTGVFADLPIYPDNIVMLGDEIIDFGEWTDFFQDTTFVNRGIMYSGTPHALCLIDDIAKATPRKIFVSAGLQDIKRAPDGQAAAAADTVIANVKEIFRRAHLISPATELYYLGILADLQVKDEGVKAIGKANKGIKDAAEADGVFTFLDLSNMTDATGRIAEEYTYDGRSLNGLGYEMVANKVYSRLSEDAVKAIKANDHEYPEISPAHHNRVSIFNALPGNTHSVMFLGNSITRRGPWEELFPIVHTTNRGVGGDVVKGIYNRLDDVIADQPVAIYLMAGINDLTNPNRSADQVWKEYDQLIAKIKKELPSTYLYVQSTLPMAAKNARSGEVNPKVYELNKYLQAAAEKYKYYYVDIAAVLSDEDGYLKDEYSIDGLHLNADAYFMWAAEIIDRTHLVYMSGRQLQMKMEELVEETEEIK